MSFYDSDAEINKGSIHERRGKSLAFQKMLPFFISLALLTAVLMVFAYVFRSPIRDAMAEAGLSHALIYEINTSIDNGNYDKAFNSGEKLVKKQPGAGYYSMGQAQYYKGKYSSAVKYLKLAQEENYSHKNINLSYLIGNCYSDWGKKKEAVTWWKKSYNENTTEAANSAASIASVLYEQAKYKKSQSWYLKSLEKGREESLTTYDIGFCAFMMGEQGQAIKWWKKSYDADSDCSAKAAKCIGDCLYSQNKFKKSRKWYEKAVDKGNKDAYTGLGSAYYQLGDMKNARLCWQKAVKETSSKTAKENLRLLSVGRKDA